MSQEVMRTVAVTIHNGKKLELFVQKRRNGFEIWLVGPVQGRRIILDHRLTHDDLEERLEYARAGDLVWRDALEAEIPAEKHKNAIEAEASIKRGTFWDYDNPQLDELESLARKVSGLPATSGLSRRSVANHLGVIALLSEDRTEWHVPDRAMLGQWTDGVVTMSLEPDHKLRWSCTSRDHPLNIGERIHGHAPDWWNFAMWRVYLMNNEYKCGTDVGVLHVGENELHVFESGHPHRVARVFKRIGRPDAVVVSDESVSMNRKPKKASGNAAAQIAGLGKKLVPVTENALVLRTDFSDDPAWNALCTVLQDPNDDFSSSLDFVSDTAYDGLAVDQLLSLLPEDSSPTFAFIIDRIALTHPDHPILVVDLHDEPGRTFRVTPAALIDVANNLLIANMGFEEFANAVGQDGIFRGFSRP